jgi:filamentous hemagglutinin family protein
VRYNRLVRGLLDAPRHTDAVVSFPPSITKEITMIPHVSPVFRLSRVSLAIALAFPLAAAAAPTGGQVVHGEANITVIGTATAIDQQTPKTIINWQGFSIASNESVTFKQPNASAVALNRVVGNERSVIDGALKANGQVFLVNSNGVLFGRGSRVDVGGLVASTRDISDEDFKSGTHLFQGDSDGTVINEGAITAADGGYVALLGKQVSNQGMIAATKGTVTMGAGNRITLNFGGDSLLDVTIDEGALDALVENGRAIQADGGVVYLTAKAADELLGAQVNNDGIIQARSIDDLKGHISLHAEGGLTRVGGTLEASASATTSDGGLIETTGANVQVANNATVTTLAADGESGLWRIGTTAGDFTVAASGGNIDGTTLSWLLAGNGEVAIEAAGNGADVKVDDKVAWQTNATLTLDAARDVDINAPIVAGGEGAKVAIAHGDKGDYHILTPASFSGVAVDENGQVVNEALFDKGGNPLLDIEGKVATGPVARVDTSGGVYGEITFTNPDNKDGLVVNGETYALIHTPEELAEIDSKAGNYALAGNMDLGGKTYPGAVVASLGVSESQTVFAGLGHTASNLRIEGAEDYTGLFGRSNGSVVIRDMGIVDVNIRGVNYVGALLGENTAILNNEVRISNVYSTGNISGWARVGGLLGMGYGTIEHSYSLANVAGDSTVGGLLGRIVGQVSFAHAAGNVTGNEMSGGLIGYFSGGGGVDNSYANGAVTGKRESIGGLIGYAADSASILPSVSNSFATGNVAGASYVAGLIGQIKMASVAKKFHDQKITIENVYATGDVTAISEGDKVVAAGLIAGIDMNYWSNAAAPTFLVSNAKATGSVTVSINDAKGTVIASGFIADVIGGNTKGLYIGSITNAVSTGNIDATGASVAFNKNIGGAFGRLTQASVSGVRVTGKVLGELTGNIGSLVGFANNSDISDFSVENVSDAVGRNLGSNISDPSNVSSEDPDKEDSDSAGDTGNIGDAGNTDSAENAEPSTPPDAGTSGSGQPQTAILAANRQVTQAFGDAVKGSGLMDNVSFQPQEAVALDQNLLLPASYFTDIRGAEIDGSFFQLKEEENGQKE